MVVCLLSPCLFQRVQKNKIKLLGQAVHPSCRREGGCIQNKYFAGFIQRLKPFLRQQCCLLQPSEHWLSYWDRCGGIKWKLKKKKMEKEHEAKQIDQLLALASFHLPRSAVISFGKCFALFSSLGDGSHTYKGPSGNLLPTSAGSVPLLLQTLFACWLPSASMHSPNEVCTDSSSFPSSSYLALL